MQRIGLTGDHLAAHWDAAPQRRYAAHVPGLRVLEGESLALVGDGTARLLERVASAVERCAWVDGAVAAAGGVLRVHARQAARVGITTLAVTGPLDTGLPAAARQLAVADLAGLGDLGLTVLAEVADPEIAALFADRVVVVAGGVAQAAYPVLQAFPRVPSQVRPVTERVRSRLGAVAPAVLGVPAS